MAFKKIFFSFVEGLKQIARNKGMAFASFISITAILIILGVFFSILVNVNNLAEMVKKEFSTVQVYLEESVTAQNAQVLGLYMKDMPEVLDVVYKPKEVAYQEMVAKWGARGYMLKDRKDSFPNTLVVKVKTLENANTFAQKAKVIKGVEEVLNSNNTIKKIISITNYIKIAGAIIISILIIVSILVVSNTIKLTVIARKEEIEIMKNVGATNWLIRGPFLFEGILIGFFASLVGTGTIYLIYNNLTKRIEMEMIAMFGSGLISVQFMLSNLVIIFIALGICVGGIGSIISIRKFLDT